MKGSLSIERRWNGDYAYLVYRDGEKVRFEYIGKVGLKRGVRTLELCFEKVFVFYWHNGSTSKEGTLWEDRV